MKSHKRQVFAHDTRDAHTKTLRADTHNKIGIVTECVRNDANSNVNDTHTHSPTHHLVRSLDRAPG